MVFAIQMLYLIALASLCAWSLLYRKLSFSYLLSGSFFISFFLFIILYFTSSLNGILKIPSFLILLLYLGICAFLVQRTRKNFFIGLLITIAAVLFGKEWFAEKMINSKNSFSSVSSLDSEWEFLALVKDIDQLDELKTIQEKYGLSLSPAFRPKFADKTDLDNYIVIGIPTNNERHTENILSELKTLRSVILDIEYNEQFEIAKLPPSHNMQSLFRSNVNDPLSKQQWSLKALGLTGPAAQTLNVVQPKETALIAIIDSGVNSLHEDISDNYVSTRSDYDKDGNGHGTHCAGIAAAVTNNRKGIASLVPSNEWVKVTGIKVFNFLGFSTQKNTIDGMLEAADMGADVISMSLGARSFTDNENAYDAAIAYCNTLGAIVVVSAGNSNESAKDFSPVNSKNVIGVAALDQALNKAYFSNTIEELEMGLCAPGMNVLSTIGNNKYEKKSGTSMAAPYVASSVALLKAVQPDLNTQEVYQLLIENGKYISQDCGYLIQPFNALLELAGRDESL